MVARRVFLVGISAAIQIMARLLPPGEDTRPTVMQNRPFVGRGALTQRHDLAIIAGISPLTHPGRFVEVDQDEKV
jgi:hypothetical protein